MSDPIAELLNKPIPEKLWHYTSIQGFQGIVTSREIFATDLRFLNDRQEFIHLKRIADEIVAETPQEESNGLRARKSLEDLVNSTFGTDSLHAGPLHPSRMQVFVGSFSAAEDQLSQWRGYSHSSSGVSLAFDLRTLRPPAHSDTLVAFAPCVYDDSAQRELVRHALKPFMDEIEGHWNKAYKRACELKGAEPVSHRYEFVKEFFDKNPNEQGSRENFLKATAVTRVHVLRLASLLKNPSFREEQEWRLVLPMLVDRQPPPTNPPRFRVGKATLIPYIAHPFSSPGPLPVVDLILGPGSDENSCSAAHAFLKSKGINVTPRVSNVPYRSL